jgi:LysR family transcriptional regulator, cyn operon transcriptional activator
MELRHLRYFIALAGALNFTRAAERLHVTQSTLSHQIKQLETEIGQALFDRVGKRVALTDAGDEFLHHATRALAEIDLGLGLLRHGGPKLIGELRIGATQSFTQAFIPECVASFVRRQPDVRVIVEGLSADQIHARLRQGSLDLGVAYRPASSKGLHFEPLYNEEMVLVVNAQHPLAQRKRLRMVELHRRAMVLLPASFATRTMLDDCFRSCGAEPEVVVEINEIAPMLRLVAQSELCCIASINAVPGDSGLHVVRLESPTPMRTPGMLWSAKARESAATRVFSTIVRKLAFRDGLREPTAVAGQRARASAAAR